ncbi:MAG: hypothetical protein ACI8XV_000603 [Arenicella sp.]|jgi:hypothetical protein
MKKILNKFTSLSAKIAVLARPNRTRTGGVALDCPITIGNGGLQYLPLAIASICLDEASHCPCLFSLHRKIFAC